jgi:glyoxylase-like metal-dependent hydrolase (beta-lactamase superfamily II)
LVYFGGGTGDPDAPRIAGGDLVENLAKLGVAPGDITSVLFSHLHRDHTGWIVEPSSDEGDNPGDRLSFPNATHYVSEAEWKYWREEAPQGQGPAPAAEQMDVLATRLSPVAEGESPVPGVEVMSTPGHTPGHLSFVISDGRERAIVLGDAVHCPIEMLEPELSFVADVDPAMAQRTRSAIAQALSVPGTIAAAPHFPDLVFGRLMKGASSSSWSFSNSQVRAVD